MTHVLTNQELCLPTGAVMAAPSSTAILAAFQPDGTVQDMTALILAANQPRAFCNTGLALAMVVTDGGSIITSARVYIEGIDCMGRSISERFARNIAGSANYPLVKPFWRIDYCEAQGVGFATAAETMSLGIAPLGVLGLPFPIISADDVVAARVDAVLDAAPALDLTNNTWTPPSAPNAARRFYLNYRAA